MSVAPTLSLHLVHFPQSHSHCNFQFQFHFRFLHQYDIYHTTIQFYSSHNPLSPHTSRTFISPFVIASLPSIKVSFFYVAPRGLGLLHSNLLSSPLFSSLLSFSYVPSPLHQSMLFSSSLHSFISTTLT